MCWRCGGWPSPVHIPTRHVGYYCPECCPACTRVAAAFPVETPIEIALPGRRDRTSSFQISNDKIIFEPDRSLGVGTSLELLIDWPAPRDQYPRLRLFVRGVVTTCRQTFTTVRCTGHEFRIVARSDSPILS